MKKIINVFLIILTLSAIVVLGIIIFKQYEGKENSNQAIQVVAQIEEEFNNIENTNKKIEMEYKGYKVVGIIEISSINIKYPILNKTNDNSMQYSITKFSGGEVNEIGNFVVAGHNYLNGTMFGKVDQLKIGDEIKLTDLYNNTLTYEIFDIYSTDPNDTSIIESSKGGTKEVTLITCTKGQINRLITKARAK